MPTLTLFVGVNGCGKTTLYNLEQKQCGNDLGERINPDEILIGFGGDWRNYADQTKSGYIAIKKIASLLQEKKSFNWETTTFNRVLLKNIKIAKNLGYKINLNFVTVQSGDIAIQRISDRVKKGGHDIDPDLVKFRFSRRFEHLNEVLPYVDNAIFYDNTSIMKIVATYIDKRFTYIDKKVDWTRNLVDSIRVQ